MRRRGSWNAVRVRKRVLFSKLLFGDRSWWQYLTFFAILLVASLALLGGQPLAFATLLGFSGTAWLTGASGALGLAVLAQLAFQKPIESGAKTGLEVTLQGAWLGLIFYLAARVFFAPTWDGIQLLMALVAFFAVFFSAARINLPPISGVLLLIVLGGLATSLVLIAGTYAFSHSWVRIDSRDRGEILVILTALAAVGVRNRRLRWLSILFFSVATILSDSRFSVVVVGAMLGLLLIPEIPRLSLRSRLLLATTGTSLYLLVATFVQSIFQLRYSFGFLNPTFLLGGNLSRVSPEIRPSENEPISGTLTGSELKAVSDWSSGRLEVWLQLIGSLNTPTEWIFGNGPGFSAVYGASVNPYFSQPHNEYLRFLSDLGVTGLFLMMIAYAAPLFLLFRRWGPRIGLELIAGVSMWASFMAHGLVNNTMVQPHSFIPIALLLGILCNPTFNQSFRVSDLS